MAPYAPGIPPLKTKLRPAINERIDAIVALNEAEKIADRKLRRKALRKVARDYAHIPYITQQVRLKRS